MSVLMQFDDELLEADCSGFVNDEILRAVECGYWLGGQSGDGMRYEGLYTDGAGAGLLFRISVPDCTDGEAQCFQKSRGIFGFMVASQMVWFALKTQAGSFDASFRKFSMDIAGRTMGRLALAGKLSALKLVFVDGQVVCAVRTLTIERDWSVRLGGWLDDVPFRDDLETILEVEKGVMESLTTDEMVLLSDPILY